MFARKAVDVKDSFPLSINVRNAKNTTFVTPFPLTFDLAHSRWAAARADHAYAYVSITHNCNQLTPMTDLCGNTCRTLYFRPACGELQNQSDSSES